MKKSKTNSGDVLNRLSDTSPMISIIIHNFKGVHRLERCLLSVLKSNYPRLEVVVVDALTDGIDEWIESNFQDVKLLHFDHDDGIPARKNAGFKAISTNSNYVVFMDEDVIVSKNWLQPLIETMESNPAIGAVQPMMLRAGEQSEIDNAGCYIDFFGYPHKADMSRHDILRKRMMEVSYAETAAVLVRYEIINRLPKPHEPFDPDYFVHWYDIDLSWKILLSGYKVVIIPRSIVYHERRLSACSWRLPYRNIFMNTRNRFITLIKNYSFLNLVRFLPPFLGLELVKIVALLRRRPSHAIATLHGILWVSRNLKNILKKRTIVQKFVRRVPDSFILARFLLPNFLRLYRDFQKNYRIKASKA